jgi:hypothetical protein
LSNNFDTINLTDIKDCGVENSNDVILKTGRKWVILQRDFSDNCEEIIKTGFIIIKFNIT